MTPMKANKTPSTPKTGACVVEVASERGSGRISISYEEGGFEIGLGIFSKDVTGSLQTRKLCGMGEG
jgi:hypothetical protein